MHEPNRIRCLIIDDEPPAREIIRRYLEQVPTLQLAGECANAMQAFALLRQEPVDLMFLDIRMPQLNGNDFLKTLKNPPKVIFTTAYPEYAVEGYELDVLDYLVKPIQFERFLRAVNKVYQQTPARQEPVEEKKSESFVYFRADRKMIKVMLQDIFYIESMKDYVKIFTANGMIITKQSISSVEAMLPEKDFIRSHRSYIVSARHIKSFTSDLIEINNMEIPIGKLFRNEVMKNLG
ncbi:MAG: response regulator transcription factor [Bacteroidetes bacterium]|jgi:two-component system LytT family response regulator|nr:MAG: response regulator transcription factor [Bacteroidota bacterium]